ncbi:MAG: UvrD-helicase domain-containing protein [Synechococcus sp.]
MAERFDANAYPLEPGLRLLEASAGTGKTFALAHLALRLITEAGQSLDQLLVVTYTDAAAAELRSRIGARLQAALQGLEALNRGEDEPPAPDPVLQSWWSKSRDNHQRNDWIRKLLLALEQLDRSDITTIHGFCRRSLRRQALSSGAAMDPQLETDTTIQIQEVVQQIWHELLETLPAGQLRGLMEARLTAENLAQALKTLDSDPAPQLNGEDDDFAIDQRLGPQLEAWLAGTWQRFEELWSLHSRTLEHRFCSAAAQWKAEGVSRTTPYSAKPRSDRCAVMDQWIAMQSTPPDLTAIRAMEKPLKDYFHPGSWCRVARSCGESNPSLAQAELQTQIAALWDGPIERSWRHCLQRGLAMLRERRLRQGVITFAGLLAAMDPGAGQPEPDWLSPLRSRYRTVMVDEFQDTDAVQWRLLHRAFAGTSQHLLLLVGDPKQAIYRFRGGDLETYRTARSQVDRIDALLENFRTTPPLMVGMNALMAPGLVRSKLDVPAVAPRGTTREWGEATGRHPLELLLIPSETPSSKTALEQQLPDLLAEDVLRRLQGTAGLEPSDLCLLVSRHAQATALRNALADRGIPTRLVNQGDVMESEAAAVLQRLIDALAVPGDERRLRLLACSALLGWNTDNLQNNDDEGNAERLDALAARIRRLSEQLPRLGLLGCLSDLLDGAVMADLSERGRLLGDLQQAARLVQDAMHRQGLNAASAAEWLRRERLQPPDPVPDARQPHSDQAESAVAVVTVHRSKGLEYPVVICPYLWEAPGESKGPLWKTEGRQHWIVCCNRHWGPGREAADQADAQAAAEAERLAYVALTRACSQLVLVWGQAARQDHAPLVSWLFGAEALNTDPALQTAERLRNHLLDRGVPISIDELPINAASFGTNRWQPPHVDDVLQLGGVPAHIDRSWGRASYSAWISTADDSAHLELGRDPEPDPKETDKPGDTLWPEFGPLAEFPRGPGPGDCLHRILEQLSFQHDGSDDGMIERELRRAGLAPERWLDAVRNGLSDVLSTPLGGPLGALALQELSAEGRLHELSFDLPVNGMVTSSLVTAFRADSAARFGNDYIPHLEQLSVCSRGFLTGSIDLVFCDSTDLSKARWWVADWKSNWIGERGSDGRSPVCGPRHYTQAAMHEQMVHHHYPLQAHLYLVALHRHLQWRLPGYDPRQHLGGYAYIFLRGMPGGEHPIGEGPGRIVEPAPWARILTLDRLLKEGAP